MVTTPDRVKKIAVIGGGPAGMYAAKTAAECGHQVTLYEKSGKLGGQLVYATQPSFKWPLKELLDYLTLQMERKNVRLLMNTAATPEQIIEEHYDAVILAVGAVPKKPNVEGAESTPWNPITIYGHETELGERIVCIGGSESSVESAFHLAQHGHQVTILSRQKELAHDANPIHWKDIVANTVSGHPNVAVVLNAVTTEITAHSVTYTGTDGSKTIECDSVVAAGGMQALQEYAMGFYHSAPVFRMISDCRQVGDVRTCFRDAFATMSQI